MNNYSPNQNDSDTIQTNNSDPLKIKISNKRKTNKLVTSNILSNKKFRVHFDTIHKAIYTALNIDTESNELFIIRDNKNIKKEEIQAQIMNDFTDRLNNISFNNKLPATLYINDAGGRISLQDYDKPLLLLKNAIANEAISIVNIALEGHVRSPDSIINEFISYDLERLLINKVSYTQQATRQALLNRILERVNRNTFQLLYQEKPEACRSSCPSCKKSLLCSTYQRKKSEHQEWMSFVNTLRSNGINCSMYKNSSDLTLDTDNNNNNVNSNNNNTNCLTPIITAAENNFSTKNILSAFIDATDNTSNIIPLTESPRHECPKTYSRYPENEKFITKMSRQVAKILDSKEDKILQNNNINNIYPQQLRDKDKLIQHLQSDNAANGKIINELKQQNNNSLQALSEKDQRIQNLQNEINTKNNLITEMQQAYDLQTQNLQNQITQLQNQLTINIDNLSNNLIRSITPFFHFENSNATNPYHLFPNFSQENQNTHNDQQTPQQERSYPSQSPDFF